MTGGVDGKPCGCGSPAERAALVLILDGRPAWIPLCERCYAAERWEESDLSARRGTDQDQGRPVRRRRRRR